MTDQPIDFDREALLPIFVAEAVEGLDTLEQCLIACESRPDDPELIGALFRAAHTLKGNSASLGFTAIADVTHVLEDILDRRRRGALQTTSVLTTLLLRAVDVLRTLVARASKDEDAPVPDQAELVRALERAAAGQEPAPGVRAESAKLDPAPEHEDVNPAAQARGLRVGLDKLDLLLTLAGEIAIARGRLGGLLQGLGAAAADAMEAYRDVARLDRQMQELVMRTRMVPLGPSFRQHARTVRDVSAARGKQARLAVFGEDVEADLAVVEQLRDPLTHMIRNALDHGVEAPPQRLARGKDAAGTISLRARHEGGQLVVEVEDDGAGLDHARILARARQRGLVAEGQALAEHEIHELIFRPGFSTAESVTELSGRGVGMDVVRRNVASLRGVVEVASSEGRGTRLTVRLPLTLTLIPGFLVAAGGERYVLPMENVVECLPLPATASGSGASGVADLDGQSLPFLRVRRLLGGPGPGAERESLVVVEHGDDVAGLAVDGLVGEAQIVVKPIGPPLQHVPGVSGSTILSDGQVALILDVAALLREARREAAA